jgi:hypothetical protein
MDENEYGLFDCVACEWKFPAWLGELNDPDTWPACPHCGRVADRRADLIGELSLQPRPSFTAGTGRAKMVARSRVRLLVTRNERGALRGASSLRKRKPPTRFYPSRGRLRPRRMPTLSLQ